jgi:hypothetical protein
MASYKIFSASIEPFDLIADYLPSVVKDISTMDFIIKIIDPKTLSCKIKRLYGQKITLE